MKKDDEKVKISKEDIAIMQIMTSNCRLPLSAVAKLSHMSRERTTYRFQRLLNAGVISSFVTEIDASKLGFSSAAVFLKIARSHLSQIILLIKENESISWSTEFSGTWNIGFGVFGKNFLEIDEKIQIILSKVKPQILYSEIMYIQTIDYYYHKYFRAKESKNKKIAECSVDSIDKKILRSLSQNPRRTILDIAAQTKITAATVQKHIKKLVAGRVITNFAAIIQLNKIDRLLYSVFFTPQDFVERNKLLSYCQTHPDILFAVTYYNESRFEVGIKVKSPYDLAQVISQVEEFVHGTRVSSVNLVQEEIVGSGLPSICFK